MSMKSSREDGGACWRKWYLTRIANLLRLSGPPPANLCLDQLNLTVICRFAEELLGNARIVRYMSRIHPEELQTLKVLLLEFEQSSE